MRLRELVEIIACRPILMRSDLAIRYQRSLRTIDVWHSNGTLPAAVYLKGSSVPMWRPTDIERAEKCRPVLKNAKDTL